MSRHVRWRKEIMQTVRTHGLLAVVLAALLALGSACSKDASGADLVPQPIPVPVQVFPNPTFAAAGAAAPGTATIADIAERVVPSVVNIASSKASRVQRQRLSPMLDDPFFREFFGQPQPNLPQQRKENSLGSGVIVSADGLILTSNHVVDGADQIRVTLADRREYDARVVGSDPQSDLAVLKLESGNGKIPN